jgi:hypothetical protein
MVTAWDDVRKRLEVNWENWVEISVDELQSFSLSNWNDFQIFLKEKTANFLVPNDWDDYNRLISLTNQVSASFLDTTESIKEALVNFQEKLDPKNQSIYLMAAAGTQTKLSFGHPKSGESYDSYVVENVENELSLLIDTLKIGKKENLIGESFDNHLEAIELLSDFGKSFLVLYLGDTPRERSLLMSWAPKRTPILSNMTSAVVAGCSGEIIDIDEDAVINPRFIHLLLDDDNVSQPWWMEMPLWMSAADTWKNRAHVGFEDFDLEKLTKLLRNSLDPRKNSDPNALEMFEQDRDMFENLLNFLDAYN